MTSDEQQSIGYFSHVNECRALTEQVPQIGPVKVKLTCFDVGINYFAFGSDCGALFIFNRRINRTADALRTNIAEVITCVKLFSGENDLLAAGHKSGGLALLNFPSGKPGSTRKLEQTLLFDGHKGHAVTCIAWTEDGTKVFSADNAGVVVLTSIDFVHGAFQTTFVCIEHSYVIQMQYATSLLVVCTPKRVTVIDENSLNSMLEIDEYAQKAIDIHMTEGPFSAELFILLLQGVIVTYDVSSGKKKESFNLPDDVVKKPALEDRCTDSDRSQRGKRCMLPIQSQILAVVYNNFIVLLNIENGITTLSSFELNGIIHVDTCDMCCFCVDPKCTLPTVYILNSDCHVFRLSSDEAPSYLAEAHEITEEFSAKNLLINFQKTAKLLPYTSRDALWGGFKVAKDMNVFSSLHPILNAVIDSNNVTQNASEKNSQNDESSDSDSETNKLISTGTGDSSNISKNFGIPRNKFAEQMRLHPRSIMDNVNKMARKLVDTVGGFGAQAGDGFLVQPVYDAGMVGAEETLYPFEQSGMLQEIMVRRTKKAPAGRRKNVEEEKEVDERNLMGSLNEELSPVNECALKNIREVLTISPEDAKEEAQPHDDFHHDYIEQTTSCHNEDCRENAVNDVECTDDKNEGEERNSMPVLSVTEDVPNSLNLEVSAEGNAYDILMKNAVERKPTAAERTESRTTIIPDSEKLIKEIAVVNNFGDIWSEIKLPYSCCSVSVSSEYIIICHSKKRKRPRYLSIPYCGTPQWITLKQKAEQFIVNDGSTLVWKIYKNVAYASTEGNSESGSFPTAVHWTAVASEGGGIVEVALTNSSAWYITKSGEVYVQLRLPDMGILSRCETSWPLHAITASEAAVWALHFESNRLVVRVGLKHSPIGLDWVEAVPIGPTRLISICLHGDTGWAIDDTHSLWFTTGVGFQTPFGSCGNWMKVYNPWDASPDIGTLRSYPWFLRVSSAGVFVCVDHKCYWASSTSMLSGHRLEHVVPDKLAIDDNFELIAGGSLNDECIDSITLCRADEIFLYRLNNNYFYSLPAFPSSFCSEIVEISSFDESLYILDSSGCIYVKENISTVSPFGDEWKILDTGPCGAPVVSFAVTSISLWVVTANGEAFLFVKKEKKEPFVGTNPAWIHVKAVSAVIDKIRASFNGAYVWVFSRSSGRAWARSFISDSIPSGKLWIEASDEPGVHEMAVGCKVVWSLSASGLLHRLQGLAAGNPAGNYWKSVPLSLKTITLDRKDRLWGIDANKRLVSHKIKLYPPTNGHRSDYSLKHGSNNSETIDEFVSL